MTQNQKEQRAAKRKIGQPVFGEQEDVSKHLADYIPDKLPDDPEQLVKHKLRSIMRKRQQQKEEQKL